MNKRAQATGIVIIVIGVIIGIILIVGVGVPITKSVLLQSNITGDPNNASVVRTGVDATIGTYLTTFLMIGGLVLIAGIAIFGLVMRR